MLVFFVVGRNTQNCLDGTLEGRKTKCVHVNGDLLLSKVNYFVPIPIAHSSAEAEYNACAFALTDAIYVKQVWNFMNGRHLGTPITFATLLMLAPRIYLGLRSRTIYQCYMSE